MSNYPLRLVLFGMAAVPMLALVASLAYDTYHHYLNSMAEAYRTAAMIRTMAAAQTEQFLGRTNAVLATLAQRPDIAALDAARCDPVLAELKRFQPAYANLLTLDLDGRLVCSARDVPGAGIKGPDPRYYFAEVIRTGNFTVGKPARGFATGLWVSTLAYPIRDTAGQISGVVAIAVDLVKYQPLISPGAIPPDMVVGIIDKAGTIVARSEHAAERVGKQVTTEMSRHILAARTGTLNANDYQGIRRLITFAPLANSDWTIFVALDHDSVIAPVLRLAWLRFALVFGLILAVGAITAWVARHVATPVNNIFETMQQVGAGAAAQRATVAGPAELRQIAGQLNAMLDALKQADTHIRQSEERFRTAFHTSPNALVITSLVEGTYLEVNDGFTPLSGWQREEVIGKTVYDISIWRQPGDRRKMLNALRKDGSCMNLEADFVGKDGTVRTGLLSAQKITLGSVPCVLSIIKDISARKASEEQIHSLSFSDPLTGLPNRRLLLDRLSHALVSCLRNQRQAVILFVDLDDFKTINESFGLDHGDQILREVAARLSGCVRQGDTVARLGGDEFAVLLEDLSMDPQQAASQAEAMSAKVLAELRRPYQHGAPVLHCSASIGIALFGQDPEDPVEPLKRAELAMYQAKSVGRDTWRFFDPQMQAAVSARAALEIGLREAIRSGHLELHYQVQVTHPHQATGVEALVRWRDPRRGMVSPAQFIPFAEQSGLILPLGQWVLEQACAQIARWSSNPAMAELSVAVNVSARQFAQADFVDQVLSTLARSGTNPRRLKLEMTESMLAANIEDVITKMNALKGRGVGFSLDDFGTGYSSLSYLKRLPLDQLKIDQSFVRDILVDSNDAAIARMVIALARSMGLEVIAEGVETAAQRDLLEQLGCRNYQGYLFGRPMPAPELELSLLG